MQFGIAAARARLLRQHGWAGARVWSGQRGVEGARDPGRAGRARSRRDFWACEGCVGQVAVALLLLELGLDDVGMGDLAGGLALLGESGEAGGFVSGALRYSEFAVSREGAVEEADHGGGEAAAGDLELCGGHGERQQMAWETALNCWAPIVSLTMAWLTYSCTALLAMKRGAFWEPVGPAPFFNPLGWVYRN